MRRQTSQRKPVNHYTIYVTGNTNSGFRVVINAFFKSTPAFSRTTFEKQGLTETSQSFATLSEAYRRCDERLSELNASSPSATFNLYGS